MIPIYRAKKLNSDEYVVGYLNELIINDIKVINEEEQADISRTAYFITDNIFYKDVGNSFTYCGELVFDYKIPTSQEVDPTTLSIHFPDMLDNQGNKIFASLSEDGRGGDIHPLGDISKIKIIFKNGCVIGVHHEEYSSVKNLSWGNISRVYDKDMKDIFKTFVIIGIQQ